jgi:hypothetical protein
MAASAPKPPADGTFDPPALLRPTREPPLVLRDQDRLVVAVPIARHLDPDHVSRTRKS